MRFNKQITVVIVILMISCITITARVMAIELIENGEFEIPSLASADPHTVDFFWQAAPEADVPGWSSSSGFIELWGANVSFSNQPEFGTDGLPHGQSHEITFNSHTEFSTQETSVISAAGFVNLTFDTWKRFSTALTYSLKGSLSGVLVSNTHIYSSSNWEQVSHLDIPVVANETLRLTFQAIGDGGSGAHIDQVSLQYRVAQEPTIISIPALSLWAWFLLSILLAGTAMIALRTVL